MGKGEKLLLLSPDMQISDVINEADKLNVGTLTKKVLEVLCGIK